MKVMAKNYSVIVESGSLSGGICNPAYFTKEEAFDSYEKAYAYFLEEKARRAFCSPDDSAFLTKENAIVFFNSRGYGLSDCSEYHRVTLCW